MGAAGFGEIVKWALQRRINWDDPRLEPMWNKLEELHMPINWHVADPSRYWRPESPYNTLEGRFVLKAACPSSRNSSTSRSACSSAIPNLVVIASHSQLSHRHDPASGLPLREVSQLLHRYLGLDRRVGPRARGVRRHRPRLPGQHLLRHGRELQRPADEPAGGSLESTVADLKAFHVAHFLFLGTRQTDDPQPLRRQLRPLPHRLGERLHPLRPRRRRPARTTSSGKSTTRTPRSCSA